MNNDVISYPLNGKYGKGKFVLISIEDYKRLNNKKLCCLSSGYVMIWDKKLKYFHRWVLNLEEKDSTVVDHMDGNKLNCTRDNLRITSHSQNMLNRKKIMNQLDHNDKPVSASKYKGVRKSGIKWVSYVQKDNKKYQCGIFDTEEEAGYAYNRKAIELYDDYVCLNVINGKVLL
jgi:hypothetical protein